MIVIVLEQATATCTPKEIIMFLQNIKLYKPYVVIEKNRVQLSSTEKVLIKK